MNGLDSFYGIPDESRRIGFLVICVVVALVLGALGACAWFYARRRRPTLRSEQQTPEDEAGSRNTSQHRDAYTILGVRRGDSFDEIRRAYRDRMKEYHPDRVAGLGEELRELAERKAKEINMAYEELQKTDGAA